MGRFAKRTQASAGNSFEYLLTKRMGQVEPAPTVGLQKFFLPPLKPEAALLIFFSPLDGGVRAPLTGPG